MADSTGSLIANESYSYDAYGVLLGGPRATQTDLLYTGEQFDTDAQSYYLRARYYNPANGLFNRTDPFSGSLSDPQSLHKYLYAHNNPVNAIDPSGKSITGIVISAIKFVAIAALIYTVVCAVLWAVRAVYKFAILAAADFMDGQDLEGPISELNNRGISWPRLKECADWLQEAVEVNNKVKVFSGRNIYGAHAKISPYIFISEWVLENQNDLGIALVLFGEWQHHPAGGGLNEEEAQAEFEEIRQSLSEDEMTPFIEGLTHGGRPRSFWWPWWW